MDDAAAFAASGIARRCLRALVEVRERDGQDPVELAAAMDVALEAGGVSISILHHGFGAETWRVVEAALKRGRDIRVGLEDTFTLPDGAAAPGNAELVAAAVMMARSLERGPLL